MVEIVTVPELQGHLRLDDDGGDDAVLADLIVAARRAIENRIDGTIVGDTVTIKSADIPVARQAVLMLAAHWYENRETSTSRSMAVLPMSVEWLITPMAKLGV